MRFDFGLGQGRLGVLPPVAGIAADLEDHLASVGAAIGHDIGRGHAIDEPIEPGALLGQDRQADLPFYTAVRDHDLVADLVDRAPGRQVCDDLLDFHGDRIAWHISPPGKWYESSRVVPVSSTARPPASVCEVPALAVAPPGGVDDPLPVLEAGQAVFDADRVAILFEDLQHLLHGPDGRAVRLRWSVVTARHARAVPRAGRP